MSFFLGNIIFVALFLNSPTFPPENAEQDWDGGDPREQRGDVGGQGSHLEELLCFEQVGLSNNLFCHGPAYF